MDLSLAYKHRSQLGLVTAEEWPQCYKPIKQHLEGSMQGTEAFGIANYNIK